MKDKEPSTPDSAANGNGARNGAQDDGEKDYLISTERAEAIARWIREAPLTMGGKKKRPTRKKRPANGVDGAAEAMAGLDVNGAA